MLKILLLLIGIISLIFGVKFVYDARPIVKKYFGSSDKNDATAGLKILGFVLLAIGCTVIYFIY